MPTRRCDLPGGRPENLLTAIPDDRTREHITALAEGDGVRIERIVSHGQTSPPGFWYDQDDDEWVVLVAGSARLRFADANEVLELGPGDHVLIRAHCRHRVEWTDRTRPTIWLTVHFQNAISPPRAAAGAGSEAST